MDEAASEARVAELEAALRAILHDRTEVLYAWATERGIGEAEWKRRSAVIDQAERALGDA